jgi:hypothetical protein
VDEVYLVTGIPRTGTSHFMHMLKEGGMDVLYSEERQKYELNSHGCFEVSKTEENSDTFLKSAFYKGKAIKVFLPKLLKLIPRSKLKFRIILPLRQYEHVAASHQKNFDALTGVLKEKQKYNSYIIQSIFDLSMHENVELTSIPLLEYNKNPIIFWHELINVRRWPLNYERVSMQSVAEVYGAH